MTFAEPPTFAIEQPAPKGNRFESYVGVIYALVMHDIKNRFFGNGLGQVVMVLWPFVHIVVLLCISLFTHRPNPYGSSSLQYTAVSVFPFIIFNYCGRWISLSSTNKSFLAYPIIRPMDLLVARAILEVISMTAVAILLVILVVVSGADAMPASPLDAAECLASTVFLAIAFGVFNAPIVFVLPLWAVGVTLFIVTMWVASGVTFIAAELPEVVRIPLSYNPLLHCVEWMRIAYYNDYPTSVLDKLYILSFALAMMTCGLVMMRVLRRFF